MIIKIPSTFPYHALPCKMKERGRPDLWCLPLSARKKLSVFRNGAIYSLCDGSSAGIAGMNTILAEPIRMIGCQSMDVDEGVSAFFGNLLYNIRNDIHLFRLNVMAGYCTIGAFRKKCCCRCTQIDLRGLLRGQEIGQIAVQKKVA